MSKDKGHLLELLKEKDSILLLDNDSCYVDIKGDADGYVSFDFGPEQLVIIFGEALGINMEKV